MRASIHIPFYWVTPIVLLVLTANTVPAADQGVVINAPPQRSLGCPNILNAISKERVAPTHFYLLPGTSRYEGSTDELVKDWESRPLFGSPKDDVAHFTALLRSPYTATRTIPFENAQKAGVAVEQINSKLTGVRVVKNETYYPPMLVALPSINMPNAQTWEPNNRSVIKENARSVWSEQIKHYNDWNKGDPAWHKLGTIDGNARSLLGRFVSIVDSNLDPKTGNTVVTQVTGAVEEIINSPDGTSLRIEALGVERKKQPSGMWSDEISVKGTHFVPVGGKRQQTVHVAVITYPNTPKRSAISAVNREELDRLIRANQLFLEWQRQQNEKRGSRRLQHPSAVSDVVDRTCHIIAVQPERLRYVRLSGKVLHMRKISTAPLRYSFVIQSESNSFLGEKAQVFNVENVELSPESIWLID